MSHLPVAKVRASVSSQHPNGHQGQQTRSRTRADTPAQAPHTRMGALAPTRGGSETILVVEDEEMLRDLICSILQSHGYPIIIAIDGEDAIRKYSLHHNEIALVVSDIGLPKLSGEGVLKKLMTINPKVKCIFASGFVEPKVKAEMFRAGASEFIQKPYAPNELLTKIRQVLEG